MNCIDKNRNFDSRKKNTIKISILGSKIVWYANKTTVAVIELSCLENRRVMRNGIVLCWIGEKKKTD